MYNFGHECTAIQRMNKEFLDTADGKRQMVKPGEPKALV